MVGHWRPTFGPVEQNIEIGVRLHHDRIRRKHSEDAFLMRSGTLVPDTNSDTAIVLRNRGSARAWAFHVYDQMMFAGFTVAPGARLEVIHTAFKNRQTGEEQSASNVVLIPGLGLHYQLAPWLGVLAGVHQGFGSVAPGQPQSVQPEKSVNYEAGARLAVGKTKLELIGFFNNYSNISGECTQSLGTCPGAKLNQQFNGGKAYVYGLEAVVDDEFPGPWGLRFTGRVAYTLTLSKFRTDFRSDFPLFGVVRAGDELPYVPKHQATLHTGVSFFDWKLNVSMSYVGSMRDVAGQGNIETVEKIEDHVVVDLASSYKIAKGVQLYATVSNLFGSVYMVSRRPFGARPGRPFQFMAGVKATVGE